MIAQKRQERPRHAESTRGGRYYVPNVDIIETDDELLVLADVPGAKSEDIEVQFDNGVLTIYAKVPPRQGQGTRWLLREYGVGDYYRAFSIGEEIDASRISAELKDGVLTLHLPKREAIKPKRIEVRAG